MTAPVTAVTGLPGNGKTLYTICMVKEWAEREKREVYYNGIEILDPVALPWKHIEAKDWHKCPPGSIIVIDEAHKTFPIRANGSMVPEHVLPIAELRHEGHNLVLITQHPMELDSAVRRRIGRHLHCVRRFGMQACSIREWSRCVENCDKTTKDSIQHEWLYNKKAYAWYKSAEVHTIKRKLPAKLLWLAAPVVFVPIAIYTVVHVVNQQRSGEAIKQAAGTSSGAASAPMSPVGQTGGPLSARQYVDQFKPRVAGLAYTAPVYDKVTQPTRAPYPAACVQSKSRCQCYTQQGTRLEVPQELCEGIAQGGFFMAWDEQRQQMAPVPQAPVEKLAGGDVGGLINLTPGHTAPGTQVAVADQAQQDGQGIRAAHRKP
jgi:hypothetical protein